MAASRVRCVGRSLSAGLHGFRSTCTLLKSPRHGDISALTVCRTRSYITRGSLSCWRHGRGVTLKGPSGELLTYSDQSSNCQLLTEGAPYFASVVSAITY